MAKKRRRDRDSSDGSRRAPSSLGTQAEMPSVPKWLPPTLFLGLTLLLFREFVFGGQMIFGGDTLSGMGYVVRELYAESIHTFGTIPRWAPDILGGTPFLEALSAGDSFYPPSLFLLLVMEPFRALGWKLVIHVAAAGFFMFGWARSIGTSRPAALVAGVGYMLAPFFVSLVHPGHDGKMFVTALTPLLFWAVERHFVAPRVAAFCSMALIIGLVISTTHFQMAYFLFAAVGLYAIFRAIQIARAGVGDGESEDEGPAPVPTRPRAGPRTAGLRFALFLAASLTGAGIAGFQFFPAFDYVTNSSRRIQTSRAAASETGIAWSSSWSLHPEEAMAMIVPEFAGNNAGGSAAWAQSTYWGRNLFKDNHEYAGLVLLLLAAVSFAGGARSGLRWFFTGLAGLAFLFALGMHTPIWRLFYTFVPGISLFRAPSQVMFLFGFGTATLAALGVDRLLRAVQEDDDLGWQSVMRVLWGATGLLGLLTLLAASGSLTDLWTSTVYSNVDAGRLQLMETQLKPLIAQGALIAFVLTLLLSSLTWAVRGAYLSPKALLVGLVLLVVADELRISSTFIQPFDFETWSVPDANIQAILDQEAGSDEPYRLFSFRRSGQDVTPALHGIELVAGNHPNDLSRYRELIGMVGSGAPENLFNGNIRRLLNVKYLLWPDAEFGQSLEGPIFSRTQFNDGRPHETVFAEPGLPRARLVGGAVIKSDAEAVPYMLSEEFDPETQVVLTDAPPLALQEGPVAGTVTWLERTPNRLRLSVTTEQPAMLVIADNWFPAWRATVDGGEQPVLRAYHTLRTVPIPAGEHTVEMTYESDLVRISTQISLLLFFLVVGAGGFDLWRGRRTREAH
jgi:hypothetical protein